jgi:hypothetical protein
VFLVDVDNTLLDNDRLQEDLGAHLEREFGAASRARYWAGFEALRGELGYADYLGALQRFRASADDSVRGDPGCCSYRSFCSTIRLPIDSIRMRWLPSRT